jgi:hypothetical protein
MNDIMKAYDTFGNAAKIGRAQDGAHKCRAALMRLMMGQIMKRLGFSILR